MTGSLYTAGGWKPAQPYRRRDPRETTPHGANADWYKREQKTRAEQDKITAERKARRDRLIHIPPKKT
jgi:hypothetical protein